MKRLALILSALAAPAMLLADVKLDSLFQDHYVFCANKKAFVSGRADPGEKVTVSIPSGKYSATTGADGRFRVDLPAMPMIKTPFTVTVSGKNTIELKDVVSGLVLMAGGQSNMEVMIKEALNPEKEAAAADYPLIREFRVEHDFNFVPAETLKGKWTVVTPKTAPEVGAASFYCARFLQKHMDGIPVGIINNSYGGSPQHAWIPLESVQRLSPGRMGGYNKYKHLGHDGLFVYLDKLSKEIQLNDSGKNVGEEKGWHKVDFDDSKWKDIKLPAMLEAVFGEKDGSFWFRRWITVPEQFAGKDLMLELGVVDDYDVTYFNGTVVGKTGEETPDTWKIKRFYTIPGNLVKPGKNLIAVRCFDSGHAGGMFDKPMTVKCGGKLVEDITGPWKTEAEQIMDPKQWPADFLPLIKRYHFASVLYNAMFAPLKGTPVNAILWYQGETNAGSGDFEKLFRECIRTWRADLGDTENKLPFLFVQLAAFTAPTADPNECGDWPKTRNDQANVLDIPHTYMVTALDIGDAKHIHPKNKQELGRRFALYLLQDEFKIKGFENAIHYPVAANAKLSGDKKQIVLTLKSPEKLLLTDGNAPHSFAIAGPEVKVKHLMKRTYHWAKAEIKGNTIVITVPDGVTDPEIIRYGWTMNPQVNVANELGFPLLPFEMKVEK